jgi:hypothetical protein
MEKLSGGKEPCSDSFCQEDWPEFAPKLCGTRNSQHKTSLPWLHGCPLSQRSTVDSHATDGDMMSS